MPDELICVGAIGGAYGVRGEVRIKSFCAVPEDIESYSPLSS
ncbi:MAG: ribosome maturation factor RimM, partial [Pseudomonadota bacterium]